MIAEPNLPELHLGPTPATNGNGTSASQSQLIDGKYFIKELRREDLFSRGVFPDFVDRALRFIPAYGSDTDPVWLQTYLYSVFQAGSDEALMLAAFDTKGILVAHLIAVIQALGQRRYGLILQIEKQFSCPDLMSQGEKILEDWAARQKLAGLANMAVDEKRMRIWRKRGYGVRRFLMVKPLEAKDG